MWALARSSGRRDTLIIRGVLRQAPTVEFEALDARSWSARDALPRVPREWNVRQVAAPGGLVVHHSGAAALVRGDEMLKLAQGAGLAVKRLSVRRSEPNFQIHVAIPGRQQTARAFFEAVHAGAERALA
jgi:hypothetical protein